MHTQKGWLFISLIDTEREGEGKTRLVKLQTFSFWQFVPAYFYNMSIFIVMQ